MELETKLDVFNGLEVEPVGSADDVRVKVSDEISHQKSTLWCYKWVEIHDISFYTFNSYSASRTEQQFYYTRCINNPSTVRKCSLNKLPVLQYLW